MAGRHYLPPESLKPQPTRDMTTRPYLVDDHHRHHHPRPCLLQAQEERIASQHREIQSLLLDNQRLAATHVALKQELSSAHHDLRHLSSVASQVKSEKDSQIREVFERSLKMESELRSIDALSSELSQVKDDIHKLSGSKLELSSKLKSVEGDLLRARSEVQHLPAVEAEIEAMRQHIHRGRAAIEYEKKVHATNLELSQAMEKNMASMAQEIEKLRAELANADKRARAAAAAAAAVPANPSSGYVAGYANPGFVYGGIPYPDPYAMHQVQGSAQAGSQYAYVTAAPCAPYDMQHSHLQ